MKRINTTNEYKLSLSVKKRELNEKTFISYWEAEIFIMGIMPTLDYNIKMDFEEQRKIYNQIMEGARLKFSNYVEDFSFLELYFHKEKNQ